MRRIRNDAREHLPCITPAGIIAFTQAREISAGADKSLLGPQLANHFAFLEGELGKHEWFAGKDFSAADIQMSFPIEAATARAGLGGKLPRLKAFVERIRARPAYQRAIEKGGAYEQLK